VILPDLAELLSLRGAAHGLSLQARRPALARLQGRHYSAQRGRGMEFEEVRPYIPGDDARTIDWRVSARRGRMHTKLFREERERPVWLLADLHPGLYFGSRRQLKSALLLRAAALLAWVAAQDGDRVGALVADGTDRPLLLPPRAREAGVLPLLEALVGRQPQAPAAAVAPGRLGRAIDRLLPVVRPGSLVLVLSDFDGLDAAAQAGLAGLASHGDCRLLWIQDPLERSGLPDGRYRAGLPGSPRQLDGAGSRPAWQAAWAARADALKQASGRLGLPLIPLETAAPVEEALPLLLRESVWAA
jgi:uncharacterized protein (DUF58 family)